MSLLKKAIATLRGQQIDPREPRRLGLTEKQRELMWRRAWYVGQQYHDRKWNWDGSPHENLMDRQAITSGPADTPPGFQTTGREEAGFVSAKHRRPRAKSVLAENIIDEFTAHLFGEKHRPRISVLGNDELEDYIEGLIEASQFWFAMQAARPDGGATGISFISFKFIEGVPQFEYHDPTYVLPTFKNKTLGTLESIEIKFMFDVEVEDNRGKFKTVYFWDRRIINEQTDTYYEPIPVLQAVKDEEWPIATQVEHGFGFCPARCIRNLPGDSNSPYGRSDIENLWDQLEEYDILTSAANQGTIDNADPTVVITTTGNFKDDRVKKGSKHALVFEGVQGSAQYMEMNGSGIDAADKRAQATKNDILEGASCVLSRENTPGPQRTATEINRKYGPMWNKVGLLRQGWGENGAKPLIEMLLEACRRIQERGEAVIVPPKVVRERGGYATVLERTLPEEGGIIKLEWPKLDTPTLEDANVAITAAVAAVQGSIMTKERAVRFIAPYVDDQDPQATLAALEDADQEQQFGQMNQEDEEEGGEEETEE